jgi:glutathione S-transferase
LNLYFSAAILSYLSDKYKKNDWYPIELKERARVNEYNHWQHLNLRANGSMLFQTKVKKDEIINFICNRLFRLSYLVLKINHQMNMI